MDLNKVVGALGSGGVLGGLAGGVAGGALSGALLSKKGRKHAGTLLKVGGLAALGSLAWKAYQQAQQGQQAEDAPAKEADFLIDAEDAGDGSRGLLIIRAMIAAAGADGHLDDAERQRILGRMQGLNLPAEEKAIVVEELLCPCSLEQILASVRDKATAIELYAASSLVLAEGDKVGERYLQRLAARLSLSPMLVEAIRSNGAPANEQAA
jgi:uncharacterized membrane protein YebE (DUF533 family)